MSPIWLLSTTGRPDECQDVLDACALTGMRSPGVVYIDGDDYPDLRLPDNWTVHATAEQGGLQASMEWCRREYPRAAQYGWLADDTYPRTHGWNRRLEHAAGDWYLAQADDLWHSGDTAALGATLTAGLCWGGELVRAVGWWALPGTVQAGTDTAWGFLTTSLGLLRYLSDVVVEHRCHRNGKRPRDKIDDGPHIANDLRVMRQWLDEDLRLTMLLLAAIAPAARPIRLPKDGR